MKKNKIRLLLICTHPQQFTGYSKVVYEIINQLIKYPDLIITVYGFQKFNIILHFFIIKIINANRFSIIL